MGKRTPGEKTMRCVSCGNPVRDGARYCTRCGATLPATAASTAPASIERVAETAMIVRPAAELICDVEVKPDIDANVVGR